MSLHLLLNFSVDWDSKLKKIDILLSFGSTLLQLNNKIFLHNNYNINKIWIVSWECLNVIICFRDNLNI